MTRRKLFKFAPFAIVGIAALIAIGGAIVMGLWNALLPPLFGWPTVTFWQALGILVLARILFGSHNFRGPRVRRSMMEHMKDQMSDRMFFERWSRMTPEERERFRGGLREDVRARCGFGPASPEAPREPSPPEHSA
ncbi:MAG TPA: hypothetical protein VMG40_10875 [Bryobacteraceae bacterium]|nr:hypothetical protein [Bryobacteraceae bacterium]